MSIPQHLQTRKRNSKKDRADTCGCPIPKEKEKERLHIVSTDESFIFYDTLVRRIWIGDGERPVIRITGSHRHSCLLGAISIDGKQLFRQYDKFNGDTFFDFLKAIHARFPKCYLFMDRLHLITDQGR